MKDITQLERVQRRVTKCIVQDRNQDYKSRLIALQLLPLMYWFELLDIMFLVKCIKQPDESFNIFDLVSFSTSNTRCGSSGNKLQFGFHRTSNHRHLYFALCAFGTPFLIIIDLGLSIDSIKTTVYKHLWIHFTTHFNVEIVCSYHSVFPHCSLYD